MRENIKIKEQIISKLKIINYDNLSDHEYIICNNDEIYHKNFREHIELESFKDTLKQLIKNKPVINNSSKDVDFEKKVDSKNNKTVEKNLKNDQKLIDNSSPKRKSFREKAKKFNSTDKQMKKNKSRKISKSLGILSSKNEDEKRQGWWTQ